MAILNNPEDFVSGENVTAAKLNNLVDGATFLGGAGQATDDSTLEVNDGVGGDGSLRVKDAGITTAKLADGAVSTQKIADIAVTSGKIADGAIIASKIAPSAASAIMPPGGLIPYAGATVPSGWLLCDGGTIGGVGSGAGSESADYETLFDLIKTLYGNTGTKVFANNDTVLLPDLRGRVIAGLGGSLIDTSAVVNGAVSNLPLVNLTGNLGGTIVQGMAVSGPGIGSGITVQIVTNQNTIHLSSAVTLSDGVRLTFATTESLGDTGGAKEHLLTHQESGLPEHTHRVWIDYDRNGSTNDTPSGSNIGSVLETTLGVNGGPQHASEAHNNVQPTIILNYIIKY